MEDKLWLSYEHLMKEDQQIHITKAVKKIQDKEDWVLRDQESRRLELINRAFQKQQEALVMDRSLEPRRKARVGGSQEQDNPKKKGVVVKKERKSKNAEELKIDWQAVFRTCQEGTSPETKVKHQPFRRLQEEHRLPAGDQTHPQKPRQRSEQALKRRRNRESPNPEKEEKHAFQTV